MDAEHIVKSYDEELKALNDTIAQMGGLTAAQIARAIEALLIGAVVSACTSPRRKSRTAAST